LQKFELSSKRILVKIPFFLSIIFLSARVTALKKVARCVQSCGWSAL